MRTCAPLLFPADLRYWQNDSFYVVTDQPWTIPNLDHIAIRPTPKHDGVPTADKAVKILAIREPGINAFVREENQLGRSILLEDAVELAATAQDLPSPLVSGPQSQLTAAHELRRHVCVHPQIELTQSSRTTTTG